MTTPRTIAAASAALRAGSLTAVELTEASLQAIDAFNGWTNAFIRVDADEARRAALVADEELRAGRDRGPLHGIPLSIKDLIDVAGQPTTAGSWVLAKRIAPADAPVVTRLRDAGAILIGKTNLHEFALGTTSEDSAFGPVRHPRDPARSPGGSSGGSAAAVATGMGLGSIGTDTGGSIRIPAAACGIVGLKPSLGDVPTGGVVPLSVTLDTVGPLARTVEDAAWLWAVLADQPAERIDIAEPSALRLGSLGGYFTELLAGEVRAAYLGAIEDLRMRGIAMSDVSIADAGRIADVYVKIVLPEGAHWHASMLETRSADYTAPVRARLESGRAISAVDYLAARQARLVMRAQVDAALAGCDALVLPTLPIVAPPIGAAEVKIEGAFASVRMAMLRLTQLFNLTGHPAISLPLRTPGLPIGLQVVGPRSATRRLLAIAAACEKIVSPAVAP